MSYCCNPWAPSGPSTKKVCGDFEEPENPDLGQCAPYREKRTCDAPVLPVSECEDDEYTVVFTPTLVPPFRIIARLFDSNCELILDSNNQPIWTTIS